MAFKNLSAAISKAVAEGADQTVAKTGGGEASIPAAGPCNLRLVAYIELGKHEKEFQGKKKKQDLVSLTFELSGRNHPPVESDSGTYPHRITITENLSLNEKARFFKLFQVLNYAGKAKHAAELLGAAFRGRVIHRSYKGRDGKDRTVAELYDKQLGVFTIQAPRVDVTDPETGEPTGEQRELKVAEPLSELRCFLWNYADMEQWQSLYIEGEYPERKNEKGEVTAPARSKNQFQLKIRSALNYAGSPIEQLLKNGGKELELPVDGVVDEDGPDEEADPEGGPAPTPAQTKRPTKGAAKGDPLEGIGA
jgi:hypothetical protein